jgi:hypothetical protein
VHILRGDRIKKTSYDITVFASGWESAYEFASPCPCTE